MNILIFSWRGPRHPNFGGAEIVTHEHAKAWVKSGHNVTLFTSAIPGWLPVEIIDGVKIIRQGNQIISVQFAAIKWYLFDNRTKFDLVIDQFHGIPFFTPLFVRTKKLAFIHEVAREVWWTNHLSFPIKYIYAFIGYFIEPLCFLLYQRTRFLTVSDSTKADLIRLLIPAKNITVIYNGVNTLPVRTQKEKLPTLIYLGAIAQDKGIEEALSAFSLTLKKNPQWQFWVVGKGENKYLSRLIVPNNVKFFGFVDEQKKFELLARAHVMLNPSHREGWGLVNIEANSVGTPVVAYNVPGCRDSIQDGTTGFLCPKNNISCLVDNCIRLMKEDKLYKDISTNAKKWASKFSWEKATMESLSLIQIIT